MNLDRVSPGDKIPNEFNVIIEIPAHSDPVKYEVDKATGAMFVDRFMNVAMRYPCNYGYVPHTLSEDGDPVDVLVITPFPIIPGAVIQCRPLALLRMTDESGPDSKIVAVPIDKLSTLYRQTKAIEDVRPEILAQIAHFFQHYKDLEPNKWVKLDEWGDIEDAKQEILDSIARYEQLADKPKF